MSVSFKNVSGPEDWGQEKGVTEDELVGWHHQLNGHEFEQTPGDSEYREAWCAALHGMQRVRQDLATE